MTEALVITFHGLELADPSKADEPHTTESRYTLDVANFRQMMDMAAKSGCCTVSDLHTMPAGNYVVLTFDDGLASDYELAFPVLAERNIKGTFYVTSGNVGKPGYSTFSQLSEMSSNGMEIGSHGMTHSYLTTMTRANAAREIRESKQEIEQRLGRAVRSYAAVGGHYHRWMIEEAWAAGYESFATMIPGITRVGRQSVLRRVHIQHQHNAAYFDNLLRRNRLDLFGARMRYQLLYLPKVVLGMQRYDALKEAVTKRLKSSCN
ncbi:MAG: polysaccharide deacetylase family protein [Nitrospirota bacterium]|nr:polysaccharide deacetylase family protein [Nitrospirota bacterium]